MTVQKTDIRVGKNMRVCIYIGAGGWLVKTVITKPVMGKISLVLMPDNRNVVNAHPSWYLLNYNQIQMNIHTHITVYDMHDRVC